MRDRIRDIKPLLAEDASIWVHLDDAEVHRMRVVLDEELGTENFIAAVVWRASDNSNNDAKQFSEDRNTILGYSVSPTWRSNRLPADAEKISHYANPDDDPLGPWFDGNPLNSTQDAQRFTAMLSKSGFTADLHFGHANIINYLGRPFADATARTLAPARPHDQRWRRRVGMRPSRRVDARSTHPSRPRRPCAAVARPV